MYEFKKQDLLINAFNSIDELDKFLKDEKNYKPGRDDASQHNGYGFTGTHSYEEAEQLFKYGDEYTYKLIKEEQRKIKIEKIIGTVINKGKSYNNIVGYVPNVPLYLNNVPNNMIDIKKRKTDLKVLNIFLNVTVSGGFNFEDIRKIGTVYATVIDVLEKSGYRINLYVGDTASSGNEKFMWMLKIKTDREPLNLSKMAFPIANPSMLRRIGFKYTEVCNTTNDFTNNGYGRPYDNEDVIKNWFKKYLKMDILLFNYQQDRKLTIEDLIDRLKKKGIKIGE